MKTIADGPIDVHTHFVPSSIPAQRSARPDVPWPSIEHTSDCCANVVIAEKVFRQIDSRCWDAPRRLDGMAAMRIGVQCLSPMPELLSYWMEAEETAALSRHINTELAGVVKAGGGRFRGFGMVPLQDMALAIDELHVCMHDLQLDGIEVGTNVNGRPIGDPCFEPFFAEAERIGAVIFVHPLRAAGLDRLIGTPALEQVVAFPCETALAVASLMTGGILHRHPDLRLVFSHGGGAFGQVLPRLQHAWSFLPAIQQATGTSPIELARRLHYDTLVYSPIALRFLIDQFGASQIVIGTDYPFAILDRNPVAGVEALALQPAVESALLRDNALRLLTAPVVG